MKNIEKQIFSAFSKKRGQVDAGRQAIDLSARKDLLSKIGGCGPSRPGTPREGSGGKVN